MSSGRRILCAVLAALLVLVASGCKDTRTKLAEHEKRGEAYLTDQKWNEAGLEFRNMLQLDPNDADAHWGLARALLGAGDSRKAYWELQETVRLDPDNLDAQMRYGAFLLFGKNEELEQAVATADAVLAKDPKRWQADLLRGRALAALGRQDEALTSFQAAVELAPDEAPPRLLLATQLRSLGRMEEAEAQFRQLAANSDTFAAQAALGGFLATQEGRADEAEAAYRHGLELAKDDEKVSAYSVLASFLISQRRLDEAEQTLKDGIAATPEQLDLLYTLARFYHAQGRRDEADAVIQEATRANPTDPKPFLLLSAYRGQNGDLDGALLAAEKAVEASPDDPTARLRKAEVLVDLGYRSKDKARIAEGRGIVDAVIAKDPSNPQALFVSAKIDLAEGKAEDATSQLRRVVDLKPDWPQAHFLLGSALLLGGDVQGARAEMVRTLELDANMLEAQKTLVRIHAALGDHELAIEVGRKALERDPNDAGLRVAVAQSLIRLRKVDEARTELEKIPADRRDAEAEYAIGRVETMRGDRAAARTHLEKAQQLAPYRAEILRALLDLDLADKRLAESAVRIEAAVKANPDDAELRRLAGDVALFGGKGPEAEASYRRAIELDPNDLGAYQGLARFLAVTGRPGEVLATYERALEANPRSASLNLIVGSLYESSGRKADAIARYQEAIRLNPDLAVAKNNLAYMLADSGTDLDRALDLAQQAKSQLPDNPNTADTLGWVLLKKNVPSAAVGYLREAVNRMPTDDPQLSLVRHHLALAYEADHQPDRALATWDQALRDLEALQKAGRAEPPWAAEIRQGKERVSAAG